MQPSLLAETPPPPALPAAKPQPFAEGERAAALQLLDWLLGAETFVTTKEGNARRMRTKYTKKARWKSRKYIEDFLRREFESEGFQCMVQDRLEGTLPEYNKVLQVIRWSDHRHKLCFKGSSAWRIPRNRLINARAEFADEGTVSSGSESSGSEM